jgi:hypothetical protein
MSRRRQATAHALKKSQTQAVQTKRRRATPRPPSKPTVKTRLAVRSLDFHKLSHVWERTEQVTSRRIPFHSPEQLIRDADKLVPEFQPVNLMLTGFSRSKKHCALTIRYGMRRSKDGYQAIDVRIALTFEDVLHVQRYLERASPKVEQQIFFHADPPPLDDDGDGGEKLPVPRIHFGSFDLEVADVSATLQ